MYVNCCMAIFNRLAMKSGKQENTMSERMFVQASERGNPLKMQIWYIM